MVVGTEEFAAASTLALEEWGMMLIEQVEEAAEVLRSMQDALEVNLEFRGVLSGRITVIASTSFARALCTNVLGVMDADEISDADVRDSVKELANVLSGHFMTLAYGCDTTFDLALSSAEPATEQTREQMCADKVLLAYAADGELVAMSLGTNAKDR